jgi:CTP synthase
VDWTRWDDLLDRVHHPQQAVTVAIVGKYVDLPDAYLSVSEAVRAAGFAHRARITLKWVPSDECISASGASAALSGVDAVVIPGGFGVRGIEGKIGAIRHARENGIPTLGLCLGLQCMTIEVGRHLAGLEGANSLEFDPQAAHPVIATMSDQEDIVAGRGDLGGTMRLGSYPAQLTEGSIVAGVYGTTEVDERHRHRYEVNNDYLSTLEKNGLKISGIWAEKQLVEIIELVGHPWFVAGQFHPEFLSKPWAPHPLFAAFIRAAMDHQARA